jgi:hypothetical protein
MRSDIIHVKSDGTGIEEALTQAERVARYKGLAKKQTIHLRLLTEELMGMVKAMTGVLDAEFWIEDVDNAFQLHLRTDTAMNTKLRRELLSVSTSGSNEAAKGVTGKIRELFEKALEPADNTLTAPYCTGWTFTGADNAAPGMITSGVWSFNSYKESVRDNADNAEAREAWDELEKSIIANLADEVKIWIRNGQVELTVFKKI